MALNPKRQASVLDGALGAVPANVTIGRLLPGSTPGQPWVDFPSNVSGPLAARTTLSISVAVIERAVTSGQGVLLVFENGDPTLPIVVGLIQAPPPSAFQELLVTPRELPEPARAPYEARLDGDRVVLEGKHEVVLKCGEASLTLRRDGKILIRGAYVETYSRGVNRIKGGSVKIN